MNRLLEMPEVKEYTRLLGELRTAMFKVVERSNAVQAALGPVLEGGSKLLWDWRFSYWKHVMAVDKLKNRVSYSDNPEETKKHWDSFEHRLHVAEKATNNRNYARSLIH